MTHFLFFFFVALAIRILGDVLKIIPAPTLVKRVGVFFVVSATWFAAIAFGIWSSIWPVLLLAAVTASLPYKKIFSEANNFVMLIHPIIDVIAFGILGFWSIPSAGYKTVFLVIGVWLIVGYVLDVSVKALLKAVPIAIQQLVMLFVLVLGVVVFVFNPSEVVDSAFRMLGGRLLSVGVSNPIALFYMSDAPVKHLSVSPFQVLPHSQIELMPSDSSDSDIPVNGVEDDHFSDRFRPETGEVVHAPLDIQFPNKTFTGNPFDLVATVTFTHVESGEKRITEMFYVGDDTWTARFTATQEGTWRYRTVSKDADLDGKSGELDIEREPGLAGFVSYEGVTWVRTGQPTTGFIPQFMMYKDPDKYFDQPAVIDADIQEYMVGHGFNGLHVNVYCRWFELETPRCGDIVAVSPNPDMRTFEALELLITKVHAQGGVVHIWAWGDTSRTQNPQRWGYNGREDQRLQRYIAARLGPMPGWTMGYGFDLFEWTNEKQLDTWVEYMHAHMGWSHMLGARSYKNKIDQISEKMDYSGYEQHWPDYDTYVASILDRGDKPSFSEDRFRIDGWGKNKDYTPDMTRQGLWRSFMAGGIANIWGNLNLSDGGSYEIGSIPYPNKVEIKRYFTYSEKWYSKDMERCNELTDGYCLKRKGNSHVVFYKENTDSIELDLSSMDKKNSFVAIDTVSGQEITGSFSSGKQTWNAPSTSDWAIAVGEFD